MVPNIQTNATAEGESTLVTSALEGKENLLLPIPTDIKSSSNAKNKSRIKNLSRTPSWREASTIEPQYKIGLILDSTKINDPHVSTINKPATRCQLTSIVVLQPDTNETTPDTINESVGKWLTSNKVTEGIEHLEFIGIGEEGCDKMLRSESIDAVYIIALSSQKQYVLQSLNAKKHVLANDPTSVKLPEFMEELECAKKNGKFIQTTAMFVHQYRVQRFMNHVIQDDKFGRITDVESSIKLNYNQVERVGATLPLQPEHGCIRVLGRFCVLASTMFFNRVGSYAESAQVKSWKHGSHGEIVAADCYVKFTNDRKLNFYVAYIESGTRQSIELKGTSRYATMNDFVIEHPDGLATYRVYDKEPHLDGDRQSLESDSFDVGMGLGQERVLWRTLVRLGCQVDSNGGWDDSEAIAECTELTDVALQMKKILIALMQSLENEGKEIHVQGV
ncbi:unnamed protein product [Pseudo-nitzschia multistriata]|uniref:Gfo/Idh/MocA-like oxidoreductase N-terminal domain-containing protein n=1 Tax=Pseudo-nitzschia multistriata TaxID=183589 RepID=A0A448Z4K7_9STRA|nr:unnamed protein product [Pseudo-nitzschia multistriata]